MVRSPIFALTFLLACGSSDAPPATTADAAAPPGTRPDNAPAKVVTTPLPTGPFGHQERWLTDADGRVFLGHGVNVVEKAAPYYPSALGFTEDDASWLVDNGFRVVRVGILAAGFMPTPGVIDQAYVQQIATAVRVLAKHQIFSLLDFHQDGWGESIGSDGFPEWMTLTNGAYDSHTQFPTYYLTNPAIQQAFQSFWDNQRGPDGHALQDDYASMFGALAKEVASEPYVLGYDLLNEPWPGNTYRACSYGSGCPELEASELAPAYAKATAAIRAAGDQHLIFGEPFTLFNNATVATNVPLPGNDANTGLSFHVYPPTNAQAHDGIRQALDWSKKTGGALLTTEWGAVTDSDVLTSQSISLDEALVPWIFWSFCCELIPSYDAPAGGDNLVPAAAAALIQAHPLVVAGLPQKLTRDPAARTLSFTWTTSRVDGKGAFGSGSVTTFTAPAFTYPTGYRATVTGGKVTSTGCASLLTVAADPGAATVSVQVTPTDACP